MVEARWNGAVLARSDRTIVVEGNHYFPREDVDMSLLEPSATTRVCPWKGVAQYFTLRVGEARNVDAVWFYPETKPAADEIRGRLAFWKGVEVA